VHAGLHQPDDEVGDGESTHQPDQRRNSPQRAPPAEEARRSGGGAGRHRLDSGDAGGHQSERCQPEQKQGGPDEEGDATEQWSDERGALVDTGQRRLHLVGAALTAAGGVRADGLRGDEGHFRQQARDGAEHHDHDQSSRLPLRAQQDGGHETHEHGAHHVGRSEDRGRAEAVGQGSGEAERCQARCPLDSEGETGQAGGACGQQDQKRGAIRSKGAGHGIRSAHGVHPAEREVRPDC
jgi:hypothetical protein